MKDKHEISEKIKELENKAHNMDEIGFSTYREECEYDEALSQVKILKWVVET